VAVAVVEPTTIQDLRQHPVVTEGSVGVATAPDRIERKALREQPIPAVVAVVAMRKARVGRVDLVW
jgi:hypothetical protein